MAVPLGKDTPREQELEENGMTIGKRYVILAALLLLVSACQQACGSTEDNDDRTYKALSASIVPFIVAGELALLADGRAGRHDAEHAAKALAVTCVATQALKLITKVERPDGDGNDSFPSGHTAAAFAMATSLSEHDPAYKWTAYPMAAAIGYSRIAVNAHRWEEVIAGALIGYFVAKQFTGKNDSTPTPVEINVRF